MADDEAKVVVAGAPFEGAPKARRVGDEAGRVSGAARRVRHIEPDPRLRLHRFEHLADREPAPVATVEDPVRPPVLEAAKGRNMHRGEIRYVYEVADAGPVRGIVVGAEHADASAPPGRRLAGDLDEVRGVAPDLARSSVRIRPGNVEVPEGGVPKVVRGRGVAKHPFDHQLRAAVGADGCGRHVFGDRHRGRNPVDRRGRREDEALHPARDARADEVRTRDRVVVPVLEGSEDRLVHHHAPREMDHRRNRVLGDERADRLEVPGIPLDECRFGRDGRADPVREVVQHHHAVPGLEKCERRVAADIARATRQQQRTSVSHLISSSNPGQADFNIIRCMERRAQLPFALARFRAGHEAKLRR